MLSRKFLLVLLLLLHRIQVGVVASKLLEGDQEVTKVEPELVVLVVETNEPFNEDVDLGA
jgi:hypothetical protein